jgi:methyl-accepting chemotaxis protein
MKIQTRIFLVCTIPTLVLILIIGATTQLNRTEIQRVTRNAVLADLGRQMQLQVREIQDFFTELSATHKADDVKEVFITVGKTRDAFRKNAETFHAHYSSLQDTKRLDQLKVIDADIDALVEIGQRMTLTYLKKSTAEGTALMSDFGAIGDRLQTNFESFVEEQVDQFSVQIQGAAVTGSKLAWFALIGGPVVVMLVVVVSWLAARSIARPIFTALEIIREAGEHVATTSAQVSTAGYSVAVGATEQAASLEETATAMEEMSAIIKRNADHTQSAKAVALKTRQLADAGAGRMQLLQMATNEIQAASQDITKILKTIDEIAFLTNILALNAAVEAARAGEAGVGFAVVADEVRNLAQRSAAAAKETAHKIEQSVSKSQQGAALSSEVAASFSSIQEQIRILDILVSEIATASREQSEGIAQVNNAVSSMDHVTQSNAAFAQEGASCAAELNGEAEKLTRVVANGFHLLGGRRQNDPVGHPGDVQSDGHRKSDRRPETASPQIFATRSTQPTKSTPALAPPRATTKITPSHLPTSDGSIDSFFK